MINTGETDHTCPSQQSFSGVGAPEAAPTFPLLPFFVSFSFRWLFQFFCKRLHVRDHVVHIRVGTENKHHADVYVFILLYISTVSGA